MKGALYCGIKLDWDYNKRTLDISMPGYVQKILQRFQHAVPAQHQDSPHCAPPRKYGAVAQDPLPEDTSDKVNKKRVKIIQQVIGGVLDCAQSVDLTVLAALRHSPLLQVNKQTQPKTQKNVSPKSLTTWQHTQMRKYDTMHLI